MSKYPPQSPNVACHRLGPELVLKLNSLVKLSGSVT